MKILFLCLSIVLCLINEGNAQDTIHLKTYISQLKKVELTIAGQPYSFLFDTGGGETFISPEIARRLGKAPYGNSTAFRMSGEMLKYQRSDSVTIQIGTNTFFHPTVGVWDLMSILPEGLPKIDGVLSLKSFSDRVVTLDLTGNRLILETPASFRKLKRSISVLPSRFANGLDGNELTIFLNIPYNKRPYWFLFDSGNLNDLLLSYQTAYEWGLQSDTVAHRKELGTVAVQLGKKRMESKAASEDIIYDGALNYALLGKSKFIIDFPRKQVWVF
ncbi:retropepsin-like aspartic protease [Pontibacter ummariensis]|uniref:retropepsin-like aspartic protease n=1 Tax=Pontibacter ummariensis TaxID=1610492 RepID=UPI0015C5CEBD|nr:retropepsin-like aspartic protease [Pontibacter ummariensis]